ncbi:cation:dicarboxylate symporter family transporter [Legionella sainthelensi]|nr:cation:dicarboxylase symporter family transporter [Legionella sainthelensi]
MIISSKGAAGVTGSGFIILASSLAAVGTIPVAGVVIILGVDRFMSGGRSLTNMIGNAIAALIISKWQKAINMKKVHEKL